MTATPTPFLWAQSLVCHPSGPRATSGRGSATVFSTRWNYAARGYLAAYLRALVLPRTSSPRAASGPAPGRAGLASIVSGAFGSELLPRVHALEGGAADALVSRTWRCAAPLVRPRYVVRLERLPGRNRTPGAGPLRPASGRRRGPGARRRTMSRGSGRRCSGLGPPRRSSSPRRCPAVPPAEPPRPEAGLRRPARPASRVLARRRPALGRGLRVGGPRAAARPPAAEAAAFAGRASRVKPGPPALRVSRAAGTRAPGGAARGRCPPRR